MNYAPILIPTLNRYNHLKRCVESLAKCTHADKTDLYIALDYPLKEEHWEGYRQIREYASSIEGFNNVIIIKRNENFGPYQNEIDATQLISEKYDRIIVTEDDNEFAPGFLDYINKGLDRYEDDPKIIAICGDGGIFKPPISYQANYLIRKGFSAWGYGTWFHKKYKTIYTPEELKSFLKKRDLRRWLKFYYKNHYYTVLTYIMNNKAIWGDGAIAVDMIVKDTFCVYPTKSLVRNYGHDGSGVHGGYIQDSPYSKVEIDNRPTFDFIGEASVNDPRYVQLLRDYCRMPLQRIIKFWIRAFMSPRKIKNLFL
jgi:glycosyltransferase involved in cell wall biosynthesis